MIFFFFVSFEFLDTSRTVVVINILLTPHQGTNPCKNWRVPLVVVSRRDSLVKGEIVSCSVFIRIPRSFWEVLMGRTEFYSNAQLLIPFGDYFKGMLALILSLFFLGLCSFYIVPDILHVSLFNTSFKGLEFS